MMGPTQHCRSITAILNSRTGRIVATRAMDARPRMSGRRAEVEAANRSSVTKIWKDRPEKQLVVSVCSAAAEVAANEVFIHAFEVCGGVDCPSLNQLPEPRRQSFDSLFHSVGKRFANP